MKKLILAAVLSAVIIFSFNTVMGAAAPVTAVDGNVTVSAEIDVADGTPVILFVLPAIMEDGDDITADSVSLIGSASAITALNVEHIGICYVEDGKVEYECVMSDTLGTGLCHVIASYIGSERCESIGTFEHVGTTDKNNIVAAMNLANKDTCDTVIDEDIFGVVSGASRLEPKEVLRKSSADVVYYNSLTDKTEFHALLYKLKGEESFTLSTLVDCFNKAGVWLRLRYEEDTLNVINTYNGTGIGKYWNVETATGSDFASLSDGEKTIVLSEVKAACYEDKTLMEEGFKESVARALFRSAQTREDIEAVISATGDYATYFEGARTIIASYSLDAYYTALLYTNVLTRNKNCYTIAQIETAITESVPEVPTDPSPTPTPTPGYTGGYLGSGSNGGGGGGGGGYKVKYDTDGVVDNKEQAKDTPFEDVADDHWAKDYIKKLYDLKIINGVSETAFNPSATITRQDFVKILVGAVGVTPSEEKVPFSDVAAGSYYEPYVKAVYAGGIVSGTGATTFGVGNPISREDAATIIYRTVLAYAYGGETYDEEAEFNDSDTIASYAQEAVTKMGGKKIFTGDENGNFNPKGNLTRAETCAILCRVKEFLEARN